MAGHLHRLSFAQAIICEGCHLNRLSFEQVTICTGHYFYRPSFAQVTICTCCHLHRPFEGYSGGTGEKSYNLHLESNMQWPYRTTTDAVAAMESNPTEQSWRGILEKHWGSNPGQQSWRSILAGKP